jgi:hypothetical protein
VERKFLGYTIFYEMLVIARTSITRFKDKIRTITRRNRGSSLERVIREINLITPGWVRYFRHAKCASTLEKLDQWLRRKIRCYRLKQLKRSYTIATTLKKMGVPEWQAWIIARSGKGWWRRSSTPQVAMAMNLKWFKDQGVISLKEVYLSLHC